MQDESDHFTADWIEGLTGQGRNKHEYIEGERGNNGKATRAQHNSPAITIKAKRCQSGRRKSVQICFDFLQV